MRKRYRSFLSKQQKLSELTLSTVNHHIANVLYDPSFLRQSNMLRPNLHKGLLKIKLFS